jgi:uncharacterized C2H2 Zn-finger protein
VFKDLKPYVCTFEDCPKPDQLFEYRSDWYEHEVEVHWREWYCDVCTRIFTTKTAFAEHLESSHHDQIPESDLCAVINRCERAAISERNCPLCGENNLPGPFRGHLARHMRYLALFALPRGNENTDDQKSESIGAQASSQEETPSTGDSSDKTDLDFDSNPSRGTTEEEDLVPLPPGNESADDITSEPSGAQASEEGASATGAVLDQPDSNFHSNPGPGSTEEATASSRLEYLSLSSNATHLLNVCCFLSLDSIPHDRLGSLSLQLGNSVDDYRMLSPGM